MTSPVLVFYFTFLFFAKIAQTTHLKFSSSVDQEGGFVSAQAGDNVTLQCFYEGDIGTRFYWYKQILGQKPKLVSTFYKYEKNGVFNDEFKNNPRFTLDTETGKNHLTITDLQISDSASYFCASSYSYKFEFTMGAFVSVKGSGYKIPAVSIQPGSSVTLNCTVQTQTGTCDDERSVYWFKDSEDSHPGLIYTHGGRNDQCERKPNTQTHTCVYNLPIKSLNLSHAGTYYCAVVSCGHILFGNGTKLGVEDKVDSVFLVYFLSGALAFTTILSVLLVFSLCVIKNRHSCQCTESNARFPAFSTTNSEGVQNEETIHYAAVREHRVDRSRRQRNNTTTECVYSSIKL